jgi:hypothetical protein
MKKKIGWSRKFGSRLTRIATIVKKSRAQLSVGLSYRISLQLLIILKAIKVYLHYS